MEDIQDVQDANQLARVALTSWQEEIKKNIYTHDEDYIHSIQFSFADDFERLDSELKHFGGIVPTELDRLVSENNLALNLPRLEPYNAIGERIDQVVHHPAYIEAGDLIYGTQLLARMSQPGGLTECLSFLFLSAQAGEAGHNCPIACSAGIIRLLQKMTDVPKRNDYLAKLIAPSFQTNFTGAQFLTEIQGGSDVGLNAAYVQQDQGKVWRIYGEKWFCSNANADLIFVTARYDESLPGTKGLGLFLVPAIWEGHKNHYSLRRLKDKIGTRSMATGEIDFQGAYAVPIGRVEDGIHLVMDNVLHLSRLFNSICVLGMARRAYNIARSYAKHRVAFAHPIIDYPLVKENLAHIKAENTAMLAAIFATARLQDKLDTSAPDEATKLLLRLLVNIQKYLSACWSVTHIHHALDMLAGNGTIETFSPLPRLLRDCIVCENWEGTHNVLRAQVLKDIHKYNIDHVFLEFIKKEIATLTKPKEAIDRLKEEIKQFEHSMQAFHQLDPTLQSLHIRFMVDKMAVLYCSLTLCQEAIDQQQKGQGDSKYACLRLFNMLHINKKELLYDKEYMKLVSQIIL
jgi:acyl-CoA dehydrogenase